MHAKSRADGGDSSFFFEALLCCPTAESQRQKSYQSPVEERPFGLSALAVRPHYYAYDVTIDFWFIATRLRGSS